MVIQGYLIFAKQVGNLAAREMDRDFRSLLTIESIVYAEEEFETGPPNDIEDSAVLVRIPPPLFEAWRSRNQGAARINKGITQGRP